MSDQDGQTPGLRERKKAKTRLAIQKEALRLFKEQGYEETTVEQIAAAAEVSPSTFFRYFPTKEDVVLYDVLDPIIIKKFRAQPASLSPAAALRASFHEVFDHLPPRQLEIQQERAELITAAPELRARLLDDMSTTIVTFTDVLAERVGRKPQDPAVQAFAGAMVGVAIAAMVASLQHPQGGINMFSRLDEYLGYLEAGLPL